jgi:hypothetical protein
MKTQANKSLSFLFACLLLAFSPLATQVHAAGLERSVSTAHCPLPTAHSAFAAGWTKYLTPARYLNSRARMLQFGAGIVLIGLFFLWRR